MSIFKLGDLLIATTTLTVHNKENFTPIKIREGDVVIYIRKNELEDPKWYDELIFVNSTIASVGLFYANASEFHKHLQAFFARLE